MGYFESLAEQSFQNNLPSRGGNDKQVRIFERTGSTRALKNPLEDYRRGM